MVNVVLILLGVGFISLCVTALLYFLYFLIVNLTKITASGWMVAFVIVIFLLIGMDWGLDKIVKVGTAARDKDNSSSVSEDISSKLPEAKGGRNEYMEA